MATSYRKIPELESLFDSEYCESFKSPYFQENLQTDASEYMFIKLIHKEKMVFSTSVSETSENVCYYFMIGFS